MLAKSDIAATRLRYEQQVYNMQTELNAQQVSPIMPRNRMNRKVFACGARSTPHNYSFSMQKQCERFKRDRDSFKQLLESAKSTIKELKLSGGRTSKGSTHSGDEDDRSKILALEQRVSGNELSAGAHCAHLTALSSS